MIIVELVPLEDTRTPNDSCQWQATAAVNGKTYRTTSRRGPTEKLARMMLADGVADQPLQTMHRAIPALKYRSMAAMADFTYAESARASLRRGKYIDPALRIGA